MKWLYSILFCVFALYAIWYSVDEYMSCEKQGGVYVRPFMEFKHVCLYAK